MNWAEQGFETWALGDARRTQRLIQRVDHGSVRRWEASCS